MRRAIEKKERLQVNSASIRYLFIHHLLHFTDKLNNVFKLQ